MNDEDRIDKLLDYEKRIAELDPAVSGLFQRPAQSIRGAVHKVAADQLVKLAPGHRCALSRSRLSQVRAPA